MLPPRPWKYSSRSMKEIFRSIAPCASPRRRANAKEKVAKRIPINLVTIRTLLELNEQDWGTIEQEPEASERILERMNNRRRKIATLLEECCLRTARIQPLLRKIQSISRKIKELTRELDRAEKNPERHHPEDIQAMREEFMGSPWSRAGIP